MVKAGVTVTERKIEPVWVIRAQARIHTLDESHYLRGKKYFNGEGDVPICNCGERWPCIAYGHIGLLM